MTQQIKRFSPHQNAKVLAVLFAISSLAFVLPFLLIGYFLAPAQSTPPMGFFLLAPFLYLVIGYVMTAIGCALYNFMFQYIGGIEYEERAASDRL